MDSLLTSAGQALAQGDPLGALQCVALREDAPALALRGIAMAQLGDFKRAHTLLRRAARAFGARHALAHARCVLAEAEMDLAARELHQNIKRLTHARNVLAAQGDRTNAAHARFLEARYWLLLGQIDAASQALADVELAPLPATLQTTHALIVAGIALRRTQAKQGRAALMRAQTLAQRAGVPALSAEVEQALKQLDTPSTRAITQGKEHLLRLDEVEVLLTSGAFIVDACRYLIACADTTIPLASRPLLFALARQLAATWPNDVSRDTLSTSLFRLKHADASLRARLRVEIGRLRNLLRGIADIRATPQGFVLQPLHTVSVITLTHVVESKHSAILALLSDGEAWASSALALALNTSQRNVQRALDTLASAGHVAALGRGRAQRWLIPHTLGCTTTLLLPLPLQDS